MVANIRDIVDERGYEVKVGAKTNTIRTLVKIVDN